MDQNKIGNLIKELRKKNHLTQEKFAEKYGVTYQAVSKWENGKNIPDIVLLKQICDDFNININDLLEGNNQKKKTNKNIILSILIGVLLLVIILLIVLKKNNFTFKTLSSNCSDFEISGSMAYNDNKSYLYISDINYCGSENTSSYQKIECTLYESNNNINKKISQFNYDGEETITLNKFLTDVTFSIDNFSKECKNIKEDNLYLEINAIDDSNKITIYRIPLSLNESCS